MWQQRDTVWASGHAELVRFNADVYALYWKGKLVFGFPASFDACARYYQAEFM